VAIFPGGSKADVNSYVKTNKVSWPVYVDADRSYEKKLIALGLLSKEISLQNTMQACVADAGGILHQGNWSNPGEALKQALGGAKWKVDPAGIPEALKPAWRALEFGQALVAVPVIAAALKTSDAKVKEAAQALQTSIKEDIARRMTEAKSLADGGQKWPAFKVYEALSTDFKDYPEAKTAATEMTRLRSDKTVTQELQAKLALDNIAANFLKSPIKSKQAQGKAFLQQLIQQFPDTEAARTAKSMQ